MTFEKFSRDWWNEFQFQPVGSPDAGPFDTNWGRYALSIKALKGAGTLFDFYARGMPKEGADLRKVVEEKLKARLITYSMRDEIAGSDRVDRYVYTWPDGGCSLSFNDEDRQVDCYVFSMNSAVIEEMKEVCRASLTPEVSAGRAYVLVQTPTGITLKSIGVASVPFEATNYSKEVVSGFEHIVNDLQNPAPCGRIIILDGYPGTGKTFLIRGLLHAVQNAVFVLVPSHMVASLASPDLIQAIVGKREHQISSPTVFVIEDADSCLITRGGDNQAAITSLLNVSDGILGNVINIRIIASTNADRMEMDGAIMRPGRLCRRIHVGTLTLEEAQKVVLRPGHDPLKVKLDPKGMSLAEIYRACRPDHGEGVALEVERKGVMGFK